jgi:DNA-binding transcriptional MerR regulator
VRPARPRYASVQAVAEMYDVDPKTVRRWIASGLIRGSDRA